MFKKISAMFLGDLALALIIFARVSVRDFLLKNITGDTADEQANILLSSNNWVTVVGMILVTVVICILAATKTDSLSHSIVDFIFLGIPGLALAVWWKVLEVSGWGYFCSYEEMMAYVGALMFGTYIYKTVKYVFNKNNGGNG